MGDGSGERPTDLQADVSVVKATQTEIETDVTYFYDKLEQGDARIMDLETENDQEAKEIDLQLEVLQRAVQDMENRDRCFSLRLLGVEEGAENGKLRELVRTVILEALGINLSEMKLHQVHFSPGPLAVKGKPPRLIIVRYSEKESEPAAARQQFRDKKAIV